MAPDHIYCDEDNRNGQQPMLRLLLGESGAGDIVVVASMDRLGPSMKHVFEAFKRLVARELFIRILVWPDLDLEPPMRQAIITTTAVHRTG